jgi:zinc protease
MIFKPLKTCLLIAAGLFSAQAWALPEIQQWQTANGARVYFMPAMELPMVDVRLVFDAGSARDNGKPGVALLTNGMLAEGAGGKTAQQLAENFEAVGASFGNGALKDMAWLSLRSLRQPRYLDAALANLKDILERPDFPKAAFARELGRMKIGLQSRKQSPGDVAEEVFYKALYGDHPYATPGGGTEQSLNSIVLADLQAHYKKYYVANNAVLAIVGQLTRAEAERLASQLLENLPAGKRAASLPPVQPLTESKTIRIDFPSSQSHLLMGQLGIRRGDPDYFTLYLANHPFGGSGFASRLVEEVREKRGLAYSVYSYFLPMRLPGPFQMGLQTRNDQVDEALAIVRRELQAYVQQGPREDELDASLKNITGSFPLRVDSNRKLVEYLSMIGFYDLPLDYLESFTSRVRAVNQQKIRDALQRRVHPERMLTVIVGGSKTGE